MLRVSAGPLRRLGLALGLRRGELLGLRWADIGLDGARLGIVASLQRVGGKLELTETKTPKSRRTILLPQYAVRAFRAHRARQAEERLAAGNRWLDSALVFTNRLGRPVEPISLRRDFRRLLKKAELPMIRLHGLRHSAASLMLPEGVPSRRFRRSSGTPASA